MYGGKELRRKAVYLIFSSALLFALAGCGGRSNHDDTATINTGVASPGGFVSDAIVQPEGSVFVSTSRALSVSWLPELPPPSQFTVSLKRYLEPVGGESLQVDTQKVSVSQANDASYTWNVKRRDNFDLDQGGVYFLETSGNGQTKRTAFIVGSNRARRGVGVSTGSGGGSLANAVLEPAPGTVYIPKSTDFVLRWPNGATPPANFDVQLRRYKEQRGTDEGGDSEQRIEIDRLGSDNAWRIRRRDDFDLDGAGVYYLEITSGSDQTRAAYIVDR